MQVKIKVDGSHRVTTRNRRFVKPLHHGLKRQSMFVSSDTTVKEDNKSNTACTVDNEAHTTGDIFPSKTGKDNSEGLSDGEIISLSTDQGEDQGDHNGNSQSSCSQSPDGGEPEPRVILNTQDETPSGTGLDRPRRAAKPNPKYSPEMYDLS